ncbi:MAG TPA: tetratricopeptide repeat protein [Gammaproteobacteria bacterium]|nr:tetratricopeptide repeat protein [Gammaproteobacteria bacterium]
MKLRAGLLILMLAPVQSSAGDFENGVDAAADGDYETALELWQPLAEAGHVDAQFNLGLMYDNGAGVARDLETAAMWYRRAAEAGDRTAQSYLGEMYAKGHGVDQSFEQAVEWYEKAALRGDSLAQYNLGILYASGKGVPLDDVYAFAWLSVARAGGHSTGGVLEIMASGMSPARKLQAAALTKTLMKKCGME